MMQRGSERSDERAILASLLDIAHASTGAEDMDRLLETITGVLGRLFPADGAALALREEGGIVVRELRRDGGGVTGAGKPRSDEGPPWTEGPPRTEGAPRAEGPPRRASLPDDATHLFGWVLERDRPLWRNDISSELRFTESLPDSGMLSDMVVPLRARGEVMGAFRIASRRRHAFDPEDFEILQRCADLTAVAVENQRLLHRTRRLSEIDGLTGVANHRHFIDLLRQEVERTGRSGRPLSLVMIDIDDFKSINDTHGHPAGDTVLRHLAQLVASLLRRSDVVARYGGEEFVAMLPEAGCDAAAAIAENLRAEVERRACEVAGGEGPLTVRISLGVATLPDHAATASELVEAADRALYRAKRGGKNRVCRAGEPGDTAT